MPAQLQQQTIKKLNEFEQGLIITCIFCFFNSEVKNEALRILNRNLLVYNTNRKSQKTKAECRVHNGEYRLINQSIAQDITLNLYDTDSRLTTGNINNTQREAPLVRFTKNNSDSDLNSFNSQLIHLNINPSDGSHKLQMGQKKKCQNYQLSQNYLSFKKYLRTLKKHQYHGGERSHMLKRNSSTPNISNCSEHDHSNRRNTRKLSLDASLYNRQTSVNRNNNNENSVLQCLHLNIRIGLILTLIWFDHFDSFSKMRTFFFEFQNLSKNTAEVAFNIY